MKNCLTPVFFIILTENLHLAFPFEIMQPSFHWIKLKKSQLNERNVHASPEIRTICVGFSLVWS